MELNYIDFYNITFGTLNETSTPKAALLFDRLTTICLACLCTLMASVTILGNLLVILAFVVDKSLRKYSNYFILNLSIADLIIGFLIPIYTPYLLMNRDWIFGRTVCTIWLLFDYVVGCASVLCILTISLDRYQLVSEGLTYVSKQRPRTALVKALVVWIIAFLVYGPAIVLWRPITGKSSVSDSDCQAEFHRSFGYLLTVACIEFFVPFLSICALNLAVYLNIRKRSRGLIRSKTKNFVTLNNLLQAHLTVDEIQKGASTETVFTSMATKKTITSSTATTMKHVSTGNFNRTKLCKDRKAARSLFILVFLFVLCWAPYTFSSLIRSLCGEQANSCISDSTYEFTFWLLWFNSTLNPFLYPLLHVQFRKAFKKILCFSTRQ